MKCLLVSYTGLGANSTEHVTAFACGLARRGWSVRVAAAPSDPSRADFSFYACDANGVLTALADGDRLESADVVHVWTPRAPIWRFLEAHGRLIGGALVLHLEDDENEVLSLFGVGKFAPGAALARSRLRAMRLEEWAHPVLTRCLAHGVDAATVLNPELASEIPAVTPTLQISPPLGPQWSAPIPHDSLPDGLDGSPIAVYSGALHPAIAADFFELCRAVRSIREGGRPLRLVRCGPATLPEILEAGAQLAGDFCDLGHLPLDGLRALLQRATMLVQPGHPTKFNLRRLPAKLAPYLASGTPVVMPSFYAWTGVRAQEHAIVFEKGDAADLARAMIRVLDAPDEARQMGARAAEFARRRFDLDACCAPLDAFYRQLPRRSRVDWHVLKKPRVELPLLFLAPGANAKAQGTLPSPETLRQVALEEIRQPALSPGQSISVAQLYWPTAEGFVEYESILRAYQSGRWRRVVFGPGSVAKNRAPRFDPGSRPGIYEIAAILYRAADGKLLESLRSPRAARPEMTAHGTTTPLTTRHRNIWRWLGTGPDPQLMLPAPSVDGVAIVECWMRWTPLE